MMVRKRKVNKNIPNRRNEQIESANDPKFQYKCYVKLENCDFSNYFVGNSNERDSAKNSDHVKETVLSDKSKMLTMSSNDQGISENKETGPVVQKKLQNNRRVVQFKQQLPNSCQQVNQPSNTTVLVMPTDVFRNNCSETTDLAERKCLRARRKVNYKEKKSIGTPELSSISSTETRRMPVYKKVDIGSPKARKRKGDLYDFVPDSDEDKDSDVSFKINLPTKKKRVYHQMKFHGKDMYPTSNNERANTEIETTKYNDKIDRILKKFATKMKTNKNNNETSISKKTISQERQNKKNPEHIIDGVFNSTMLPETEKMLILDESIIPSGNKEHTLKSQVIGGVKVNNSRNKCLPASENSSLNTVRDSYSNPSSLNSFGDLSIKSFDGTIDNLFGFADEVGCVEEASPNRINIIQNVVINRPTPSMQYISTPKRFIEQKSWRFDSDVVNRNPHYISIKKNSLPSLNQEPVLDHTFDERIEGVNKMVLVPKKKSVPRQQSILSFIEKANGYCENHNFSQSLYDIDELSPVKNKNDKNVDKENSFEKKIISDEKKQAKRNILGVINDVNETSFPPLKNNEVSVETKTNKSCSDASSKELENFGFDSISADSGKNITLEEKAKPFRIELTYKKYNRSDKLPERMRQPVRDSQVKRLVEEDPGFDKVVDKDGLDCGELGLFEDFDQTVELLKNHKPHTKKRTDRENKTKAPEVKLSKEAQKWIKQFNKMCDEVDHEQLNIE